MAVDNLPPISSINDPVSSENVDAIRGEKIRHPQPILTQELTAGYLRGTVGPTLIPQGTSLSLEDVQRYFELSENRWVQALATRGTLEESNDLTWMDNPTNRCDCPTCRHVV